MKNLITETPQGNIERLYNYARIGSKGEIRIYNDKYGDINLRTYIGMLAKSIKGCDECDAVVNEEDDERCSEPCTCDCVLNTLATVATQACCLREIVRRYEQEGKT